jgi:hypothetical protein
MNHLYIAICLHGGRRYEGNLVANLGITYNIFMEEQNLVTDYSYLGMNPNITMDIIKNNPKLRLCNSYLSDNPNTTWDDIISNPRIYWQYGRLSSNSNITLEIMKSNPDRPWDYDIACGNSKINWEMVQSILHGKYAYESLSVNPNITWENVCDNLDKKWNYSRLIGNPNMDIDTLMSVVNIGNMVTYFSLCRNPNLTPDKCIVSWKKYMFIGSDDSIIAGLCYNPNITWKDIYRRPLKLSRELFSNNMNRWNASAKIQHTFRRWKKKIELEVSIQLLSREDILGNQLPSEIIWVILSYTM